MSSINQFVIPRSERVFVIEGTFDYDGALFVYPNKSERKLSLVCSKHFDGSLAMTVCDDEIIEQLKSTIEGKVQNTMYSDVAKRFNVLATDNDEIELIVDALNKITL